MTYTSQFITRVFNRLGLLTKLRSGYRIKMLNQQFNIPIIENKEGFFYHLNTTEPFFFQVLQQLYAKTKYQFLDVGVNFGQTLLKVKAIDPSIEYTGFEPSGLCSYYASQLIKANKFSNAQLIRCALSNSNGILTLHSPSEGDTRASVVDDNNWNDNSYKELVPAVTLDSVIPFITSTSSDTILKVDVEGAELMVFEGGREYIEKFRPLVLFESFPHQGNTWVLNQQQLIAEFFKGRNYKLSTLDEGTQQVRDIESIINADDYNKTNYLATPMEKQEVTRVFH